MNTHILRTLNTNGSIQTVINDQTGHIYVKKVLVSEQRPIYETLCNLHLDGIPNIVEIEDADEIHINVYEEYIAGMSLDKYIKRGDVFDESQIIDIMLALSGIIKPLHKLNIVHRDIKPSNIMLSDTNKVFLIDFGIARFHKKDQATDTRLLGTEGFAAPEQYGFAQSDQRTDIYSIGVLANYILTGQFPAHEIHSGNLSTILHRCLKLNPDDRYQNVDELIDALTNLRNTNRSIMP